MARVNSTARSINDVPVSVDASAREFVRQVAMRFGLSSFAIGVNIPRGPNTFEYTGTQCVRGAPSAAIRLRLNWSREMSDADNRAVEEIAARYRWSSQKEIWRTPA